MDRKCEHNGAHCALDCGTDPCIITRTDRLANSSRTVPIQDQRMKADGGKSNPLLLEVDLVRALTVVNRVLDYGYEKYEARGGWMQVGMDRYDAAARRHRRDRDRGELTDAESGLLHLAHEATNLLFQLETYIKNNPGVDFFTYNPPPKDHILGSNQNKKREVSRSV